MARAAGSPAPAQIRRALLFGLASAAAALGAPPNFGPAPDFLPTGTLSAAEGRKVLAAAQQVGPAQPYYLEFLLRQLPRRGEEKDVPGRLWASRNDDGVVWRIELAPGLAGQERRFLLQSGPHPAVWVFDPAAGPARAAALFEPLAPGTGITAFDLEMPFLFWPDARPLNVNRIVGRPADLFVFLPPAEVKLQAPDLGSVRADLDAEYHVPLRTELVGPSGRVQKTWSLVDLKKVGGQTLPKDLEVRNEETRDKTRFSVTAAALGLDLSPALFAPAGLSEAASPPPAASIARFEP